MAAVKARVAFAVERWGGSGAVFAWDLWNELGHHHGVEDEAIDAATATLLFAVVAELSAFVREIELRLFGKTHLQTVSHFGSEPRGPLADLIFRHPDLDFATTHIYEPGAIDCPGNTVAAADAMAGWVRHALGRDPRRPPVHRQRDRADPYLQGPGDHPARRVRPRPTSATWPGPTWRAEGRAAACDGRIATRTP